MTSGEGYPFAVAKKASSQVPQFSMRYQNNFADQPFDHQLNKDSVSSFNIRQKDTYPSHHVSKDSVESLLSFKNKKKQAEAFKEQRKFINLTVGTDILNLRQESELTLDAANNKHFVSLFGGSVEHRGNSLDHAFSLKNEKPDKFDVA